MPTAAILTVGTELVEGLRLDTNTREIALALARAGYSTGECVTTGDGVDEVSHAVERLITRFDLVVTTGGLGPTHDDTTLDAVAQALGVTLANDMELESFLAPAAARHTNPDAARQVLRQARVLPDAVVLRPTTGTAPGHVVRTNRGRLALLPGPPREMRPMLRELLASERDSRATPVEMGCVGISESDAQVASLKALDGRSGVSLTVLARLSDVRIVLIDTGGGAGALREAGDAVKEALGDVVYSADGLSLAEAILDAARTQGLRVGAAESCTGGMLAAALTDVAGASDVFVGSIVSYANQVKADVLRVSTDTLTCHGAVSQQVAEQMGAGVRSLLKADITLAVTGIAGPGGGSADKPVGTVWFDIRGPHLVAQVSRLFPGDREAIRQRATVFGLDLMRRAILGLHIRND